MGTDTPSEISQEKVGTLRNDLKQLHTEKEAWFEKKRQLSSQVGKLINEIKEKRALRDQLTKDVQDAKIQRKKLNQTIRQKIESIKVMHTQKGKLPKQPAGKDGKDAGVINPNKLLKEIEELQYKIETEGMTFESEQKVMKLIKEKKALYEDSKQFKELFKDIRTLSKEIDDLKKESDQIHEQIQTKAVDSQKFHEEMITTSKQIDQLKHDEKEATEKFLEFKAKYAELSKQLRDVLSETGAIKTHVRAKEQAIQDKLEQEQERKRKSNLKEQEAAVRKKIASGQTLTTEDLYIFQNMSDDDLDEDEPEEEPEESVDEQDSSEEQRK